MTTVMDSQQQSGAQAVPARSESEFIDDLIGLARSREDVRTFWKGYLRLFVSLCRAREALLLARFDGGWQIGQYTDRNPVLWPAANDQSELADRASKDQIATVRYNDQHLLAVRLEVGAQEASPVLLVNLGAKHQLPSRSTLSCVAALPAIFQTSRQYQQARSDVVFFAEILQLVGAIAEDERFKLAAMRLANEVAAMFSCAQVSFGWIESDHVRLQAISNLESFDDRTRSVWELEAAMEEAAFQEAEIVWPRSGNSELLVRAHSTYGGTRRIGNLLTLPVRKGDAVIGTLTCEREGDAFTEQEIWRLRLLLELCTPWLERLAKSSLSIWGKCSRAVLGAARVVFGAERTAEKLLAAVFVIIAALLFVPRWPHSVTGTFLLKAENSVFVASPIDGFIKDVPVRPGDIVARGETLVELDSEELLMNEASALAKLARYRREAEKAKASSLLADMRIAELRAKETEKEIEKIAFHLENTKISTPFDGIVAEGDLHARIGAPVHKGEPFMTVASLEGYYVEIQIDESELRLVELNAPTAITFVGKPDEQFIVQLQSITPRAEVAGTANAFTIRASPRSQPVSWWRPGMSGMARIEADRRALWWKLTHRLFDYLHLQFWL